MSQLSNAIGTGGVILVLSITAGIAIRVVVELEPIREVA